jgi:hypothetical protein
MGHSSTRAAMIYLHARPDRDRQIAAALDRLVKRELRQTSVIGARPVPLSGMERAL